MKNTVKFTALILSLGCALESQAKSLREYRTDKAQSLSATAQSKALSAEILKIMGVRNPDLSLIPVPRAGEKGTARRNSSSIVIKRRMDKGIRTLIEEERYGRGVIFTPSSTMDVEEAAEQKRQYQLAICHKVYPKATKDKTEGSLDNLIREIHDMASVPSDRKESVVVTEGLESLKKSVQSVQSVLGTLNGVEVVEGSIASLRFVRSNGATTSVSLSMLATFLSEEDDAFIAMMDCLYDEAHTKVETADEMIKRHAELSGPVDGVRTLFSNDRSDEAKKIDIGLHRYNKEYYGKVEAYLAPRLQTARQVNALLKSLKPNMMRDLMNVMLRAQSEEIPAGAEMNELNKNLGGIINAALQKNDQATLQQTLVDSGYFTDIQKQLSRVKDTLEANQALKVQTETIIKEEIGGVKK